MSHTFSTQPERARAAHGPTPPAGEFTPLSHGANRSGSCGAAPEAAALRLDGFSYAYPGADRWTLREASLEILPGQCHCLTGRTGSGKTTLALAARALLPAGRTQGCIDVDGGSHASVGLVLENPEVQLLADTVAAEVAFGLENRCVAPREMPARVTAALAAVGLTKPLDFPTAHLSMGQKYRLLVAAQCALEPRVLILDEPVAQLDEDGLDSLTAIIEELKRRGVAMLLCEHSPGPLAGVIDRYWQLTGDGTILPGRAAEEAATPRRARLPMPALGGACVVSTRGLSLHPADATPAWSRASLTVGAGQRVALCARNGAGKTSLLRCLTGFIAPAAGEVHVLGASPSPERLRGRVGYLAQNPERQLFETTVFEEVAFPLRRLGSAPGVLRDRVEETLDRCGIGDQAARSPHRLSYGQKRLVALASIVAAEPQLLLLDDPFAGLDEAHMARVADLLADLSSRRGTAVLWTSHDGCATSNWADVIWVIEGGTLVAA
ncbi:MAG: ABC transporter ATP-binding protein [Deltaproteobacteria bacterium]|nr:ABC transporter ATP-binding protein [Deltaproteobacteria bacterium]